MDRDVLLWLGGFLAAVLVYGAVVLMEAGFAPPGAGEGMDEKKPEEKRPELLLDFNGNGVPDYREPWFWRGLWGVTSWLVKTFAKPHTLAYRGVVAAEQARAAANP